MNAKTRSVQPEWTEDELGYIVDSLDRPAQQVAALLGRTRNAVYHARKRVRSGWSRKKTPMWTAEEDCFIRDNAGRVDSAGIARHLGRTTFAVNARMSILGVRAGHSTLRSPFIVSDRALVAKTCSTCGLLLPASWFTKTMANGKAGHHSSCRKCLSEKACGRGLRSKHNSKKAREYRQRLDALTVPYAFRSGLEYTESDHSVLSDESMTLLEKALTLQRTYAGVATRAGRLGYKSRRDLLGDTKLEQWIIDNPNAANVEEITAALKQEFADANVPLPAWDWDENYDLNGARP